MTREQELIAAIKQANLNNVEKLIKEGADLNYKDDDKNSYGYHWPFLHHCIFKASSRPEEVYTTITALLLENGADMEGVNFTGETPAMFAIKYFAPGIFELLIQKGANINAVNNQGDNLFDIVLDRYYYEQQLDMDHINDEEDEMVKDAILKGEGESLIRMFKRIDALVKNGYDLNSGKYPAAVCALFDIEGKKLPAKALYYLFDKGANPREYMSANGTPFPMFEGACYRKLPNEILVEMAKRIGNDYVFEQYADHTPLTIAIRNNNVALVKSLIASGADIHIQNDRSLRIASSLGHQEITEYLVEQGAVINSVNQDGNTPISLAEKGGFTKIVDYLRSKL
jgi:ankyrin repeat protein